MLFHTLFHIYLYTHSLDKFYLLPVLVLLSGVFIEVKILIKYARILISHPDLVHA